MPEAAEVAAGILSAQMDEQAKEDSTQTAMARALSAKVEDARQKLMDKVMGGAPRPVQYPPEVIGIANALAAQPILIPAVDAFVKNLVASINAAVKKAVAEALPH